MPSNQEEFYKTLIDNLYDGVYFVDQNRVINYWNKACERITGFSREQVMGRSCQDNLLNHCNEAGVELCKTACPLTATLKTGKPQEAEVYLRHSDGHRLPVRVRVSPIRDEAGQIIGAVETFSNNSALFSARDRIRRLEETVTLDPLTKIGNRRHGEMRLRTMLLEYQQTRIPFGLLFIDIDNFKRVNDTYGHETGDRVLLMVANTLRSNLRQTDTSVRWGGEEFIILIEAHTAGIVLSIAEKLRNLIANSQFLQDENSIRVTASFGATLVRPSDSPESLIGRADQLMYQSKANGKNLVTSG
jgi:diguanylate cyclase (GGDEF)-like protein/PAS domain S-box-containing protein